MTTAKTPAQRKRNERERMAKKGFVQRSFWVMESWLPAIQKLLSRLGK